MAGLFGIYSSGDQIVKQPPEMFAARFNRNDARLLKFNNAWAGLAAEPSFKDERVLQTREDITIGFFGIIFEPASQRSDQFFERYKKEGLQFIQTLDGYFHGFIHDNSKKKLFLFTDYLSTRPLYYGLDKPSGTLAFSGDAHHTAALLKSAGTSLMLNTEALGCLLTIGYLFDDQTPVNQVRKIPFGTILEINLVDFTISTTRYFEFRKNPVPQNLDACLEQIDHLLTRSVKKLWAKDREHGFGHTALLSGGLDSRVNVMLADKLGFRPVQTITFSQSGSSDHIIAASIAHKQGYRHTFMPLDSGSYLYDNIRTYVAANDGLVAYNGAAHLYASILPLLNEKTGLLHSGQIGDILFGSLTFRKVSVPEKILRKGYIYEPGITAPLDIYKRVAERYNTVNNFERYGYEQHIMNGTFNGDRMLMHHTDMLSPFYDRKLLEFCYSLPDRFKYDQAIYLKWMKRYHPEIAEFPWAKTGIRPRNALMNRTAGFLQKVNRHARKRLGLKHDNMNPFDLWYRENPELKRTLLAEYHAHEHLITDSRLKEALDYCVRKDRAQYLMNAVTVVLAADLYLNG